MTADFWGVPTFHHDDQPARTKTSGRSLQLLQQPDMGDPASQQIFGGGDFSSSQMRSGIRFYWEAETSDEQIKRNRGLSHPVGRASGLESGCLSKSFSIVGFVARSVPPRGFPRRRGKDGSVFFPRPPSR